MKKFGFIILLLVVSNYGFTQLKFDLGLKGGVNFSKLSFDIEDYSAESATKTHFGIFTRIGWSRLFIQPEIYFSGKGGDISSDASDMAASFDYKTVDIPVLLGYRVIKGKAFDLHVIAGPVFSNITSEEVDGGDFNQDFFNDRYTGIQYGLGIDIWFITMDARFENGLNEIYSSNEGSFKNQNFMISAGFKIF